MSGSKSSKRRVALTDSCPDCLLFWFLCFCCLLCRLNRLRLRRYCQILLSVRYIAEAVTAGPHSAMILLSFSTAAQPLCPWLVGRFSMPAQQEQALLTVTRLPCSLVHL